LSVSYTHFRSHETVLNPVFRFSLKKKMMFLTIASWRWQRSSSGEWYFLQYCHCCPPTGVLHREHRPQLGQQKIRLSLWQDKEV